MEASTKTMPSLMHAMSWASLFGRTLRLRARVTQHMILFSSKSKMRSDTMSED